MYTTDFFNWFRHIHISIFFFIQVNCIDYNDIFNSTSTSCYQNKLIKFQQRCLRNCLPATRKSRRQELHILTGVNSLIDLIKLCTNAQGHRIILTIAHNHPEPPMDLFLMFFFQIMNYKKPLVQYYPLEQY